MEKLAIYLILSIFAFSVAIGFYPSNISQNNLLVLVPEALVLFILTWLGRGGADFVDLKRFK